MELRRHKQATAHSHEHTKNSNRSKNFRSDKFRIRICSIIPKTSEIVRIGFRPHSIFAYFALSLSASQGHMIQERCWFSQINFFIEYFPHRVKIVSFQPILCHPHTQIRIILFHDEQRDIPNLEFSPSHVSIGFSQIAFPITVLPKDHRTDSVQEERLDLPYWTMILAICVVVDESKCLDRYFQ